MIKSTHSNKTIAIVAPAGIIKNNDVIFKAATFLEQRSFKVVLGNHIFKQNNHFAGTDDERRTDFQTAINHPEVDIIWCARGGYGCIRIIDQLDFSPLQTKPKTLIGYSDFTVFHQKMHQLGLSSIHGPMPINFKDDFLEVTENFNETLAILNGNKTNYQFSGSIDNIKGKTTGVLIGGNLTLLANCLGSNLQLNTQNKIIFIEEIGEYHYHIDRMLYALDRAGYFKNCNGIIVGNFTELKENDPSFGLSVTEIILQITHKYNKPTFFGFPAGHNLINKPLVFGTLHTLEINETTVSLTQL